MKYLKDNKGIKRIDNKREEMEYRYIDKLVSVTYNTKTENGYWKNLSLEEYENRLKLNIIKI